MTYQMLLLRTILIITITTLALSGCGRKGGLYIPPTTKSDKRETAAYILAIPAQMADNGSNGYNAPSDNAQQMIQT